MEAIGLNAEVARSRESPSWFTVERAAYVAIGLLAASLRFADLGQRPLNGSEAAQALAAFRFAQGAAQGAPVGTVPALFTGNVVGFALMGAGDAIARWLPALTGLILVLLPYGLRHRLGRGGALAASLLLAISPTTVFFSRTLDGAILVAACGLALAVGLIKTLDYRRPGFLYLSAVALGLGLLAGTGTFTLLLIFAAFALLLFLAERLLDRETGWSSLVTAWWALRGEKGLWTKTGVVLAATFGLGATAFVLHPAGLGHAADLIAAWARSFLPEAEGQPFIYPLLLLLRYETIIVVLGMVEIGRWAVMRGGQREESVGGSAFPFTAFLIFWAMVTTLVILFSGHRPASSVLLVVAPLALLAGQGIDRAWGWISRRNLWFEALVVAVVALGLGIFFYLQIGSYSLASATTSASVAGITLYANSTYLVLAVISLVLLVALGAGAWIWRGRDLVFAGGCLALVIGLGLFGVKAMWGPSFGRTADARELIVLQATAPDVRSLVDHLQDLSLAQSGDKHTLPVTVDAASGPVIAWYLRDFERLKVVSDLSTTPETTAAVTLAAQDLPIGETFRGRGFPLHTRWWPWGLRGQSFVRWLLFNEGSLPIVDQTVVLWVAGGE